MATIPFVVKNKEGEIVSEGERLFPHGEVLVNRANGERMWEWEFSDSEVGGGKWVEVGGYAEGPVTPLEPTTSIAHDQDFFPVPGRPCDCGDRLECNCGRHGVATEPRIPTEPYLRPLGAPSEPEKTDGGTGEPDVMIDGQPFRLVGSHGTIPWQVRANEAVREIYSRPVSGPFDEAEGPCICGAQEHLPGQAVAPPWETPPARETEADRNLREAAERLRPAVDRFIAQQGKLMRDNYGAPGEHGHYSRLNPQPVDVIEAWGLNHHEAEALAHLARWRHDDHPREDLEKAVWWIQRLIQFEFGDKSL